VVRENQDKYYEALEASGSVGESTPFIEFILDVILKTLKELSKENIPLKQIDIIIERIQKLKKLNKISRVGRG